MERSPIAVPSWCKCGKCFKMPRPEEYICCIGKQPCRSEDDELKKIIAEAQKQDVNNSERRRNCYQASARLFEQPYRQRHAICDGSYCPLPSCVVWEVRRNYPSNDSKYTGFPPKGELLPMVLEAHNKFSGDMENYREAVLIADPLFKLRAEDTKVGEEKSIKQAKDLLPKLAMVATGAALEAFIEEVKSHCIDIAFLNAEMSTQEFGDWLSRRTLDGIFIDGNDEMFFQGYFGETTIDPSQLTQKVFKEREKEAKQSILTQASIGLNQTVIDGKKKQLRNKYRKPTMYDVREMYVKLIARTVKQTTHEGEKTKEKDLEKTREKKLARKVEDLMTQVLEDMHESWEIWIEKPDEHRMVPIKVQCADYEGLAHLSNLFYGIRNLIAHGTSQYTLETGVLSDRHGPRSPSEFSIKATAQDKGKCDAYMFRLWQEALTKGNEMKADYYLFKTIRSFYVYFAAAVCKMCACVVCGLSDELLLQKVEKVAGHDIKNIRELLEKVHWSGIMPSNGHYDSASKDNAKKSEVEHGGRIPTEDTPF